MRIKGKLIAQSYENVRLIEKREGIWLGFTLGLDSWEMKSKSKGDSLSSSCSASSSSSNPSHHISPRATLHSDEQGIP